MTAEQIVEAALSECEAIGFKYWTQARGPMYRRLTVRQQQLFAAAATWNEDWAGWETTAQVVGGQADFAAILTDDHPTTPGAERITQVEVADPGSSSLAAGAEITIVRRRDAEYAALAPRATIRSGILKGWGTDLDGVATVRLLYTRMPRPLEQESDEAEIVGAHVDLLIIDLARFLLLNDPAAVGAALAPGLQDLAQREKDALGAFESHVRLFAPTHDRF